MFDRNVVLNTEHRPWPLATRPWAMRMRWVDLLFAHWPIRPDVIRPLIPEGLELDTLDASAWIGIVPFRMEDTAPRFMPPIAFVSTFLELNVRTYVRAGGKPGVWFFSLDAASRLAVVAARATFHLPYFYASMNADVTNGVRYRSARVGARAEFRGEYAPSGEVFRSTKGSLDEWLTERYCLYSANRRGDLFRGEVHHHPWPLQPADASIELNTMTEPIGVALPATKPLFHFVKRLDVVAWAPEPVVR
jgi:uncharacterized protein YqjF (DUF2071 family)